ncbi:hypothetical protein NEOKW01_1400 [Nematocida sp. AWRm80]|nr:hypothetical protein NEOKW01_1400 [Nematocida sp. AWRm80]
MTRPNAPKEISSRKERTRKEPERILDPRFNAQLFDPLRHAKNYSFLYEYEQKQLIKNQSQGKNVKQQLQRIQERERLLRLKEKEKEARQLELDLVKQGKKPFYLSRQNKKLIQALDTAEHKGIEHVTAKLRKKQREKDNKSRELIENNL